MSKVTNEEKWKLKKSEEERDKFVDWWIKSHEAHFCLTGYVSNREGLSSSMNLYSVVDISYSVVMAPLFLLLQMV
jgi:hypothetical protein